MTSSKSHQPWINTETKRLLRQKRRAFENAKFSNSDKDWTRYRNLKKLTQKVCRKAHDSYIQNIFSEDPDNKKLWGHIRSQNKDKSGISDLESNLEQL